MNHRAVTVLQSACSAQERGSNDTDRQNDQRRVVVSDASVQFYAKFVQRRESAPDDVDRDRITRKSGGKGCFSSFYENGSILLLLQRTLAFVPDLRTRAPCLCLDPAFLGGSASPAGKADTTSYLPGAVPWGMGEGTPGGLVPRPVVLRGHSLAQDTLGTRPGWPVCTGLGRGMQPAAQKPSLPWTPAAQTPGVTAAPLSVLPSGQSSGLQAASACPPCDPFQGKREEEEVSMLTFCHREMSLCCSVAKSCLTLRPRGLQHARLSCPSPSPGACSNSCPLNG